MVDVTVTESPRETWLVNGLPKTEIPPVSSCMALGLPN